MGPIAAFMLNNNDNWTPRENTNIVSFVRLRFALHLCTKPFKLNVFKNVTKKSSQEFIVILL